MTVSKQAHIIEGRSGGVFLLECWAASTGWWSASAKKGDKCTPASDTCDPFKQLIYKCRRRYIPKCGNTSKIPPCHVLKAAWCRHERK